MRDQRTVLNDVLHEENHPSVTGLFEAPLVLKSSKDQQRVEAAQRNLLRLRVVDLRQNGHDHGHHRDGSG